MLLDSVGGKEISMRKGSDTLARSVDVHGVLNGHKVAGVTFGAGEPEKNGVAAFCFGVANA